MKAASGPFASVEAGDRLLVNRGGASFYCDAADLGSLCKPDDLFLVNRHGKSFSLRYDQLGTADDLDLFLITRAGKSYHATKAELDGALEVDVTFSVSLQTARVRGEVGQVENSLCGGNNYSVECQGGRITATVTASSNSSFTVNSNLLTIDGEWILCCGSPGMFGFTNQWHYRGYYMTCNNKYYGNEAKPYLSGAGQSGSPSGGAGQINFGTGPYPCDHGCTETYGNTGSGGYGMPRGETGQGNTSGNQSWGRGGGSTSRHRATNSGDMWNGIKLINLSFTNHNDSSSHGHISANGKTLSGSGVIGELL